MSPEHWSLFVTFAGALLAVVLFAWALWIAAPVLLEEQAMFKVYTDAAGEFRWRLVAANGRVVADSGEGYSRRRDCVAAVKRAAALASRARIK